MSKPGVITKILAREILNFRGDPTVETDVLLSDGSLGRAAAPAGISTGSSEVGQLLDGDKKRLGGRGVLRAVQNIKDIIAPALKGMPASPQESIDKLLIDLDGTPNKKRLGGNAILAVSLATAYAASVSQKVPLYRYVGGDGPFRLPVPVFDLFCGGAHSKDSVDFQEYLIIPAGLPSLRDAIEAGGNIYKTLRQLLQEKGYTVFEIATGPLSASLKSNREGVELFLSAIEKAGYKPGKDCFIGIDAATSELYKDERYTLSREGKSLSSSEMVDLWEKWVNEYPIISIEDAMSEEDWDGWRALTQRIGNRVELVGDDFFTTNPERVKRGIALNAANAVLIKPNQIGTLSETLQTMDLAYRAGWSTMVSTRSGETEDTTISDLSVLPSCGQIKTGPPRRQVIVKYNRLLRIEEDLGNKAEFIGMRTFKMLG